MAQFNGNDLVLGVHSTDGSEVKFAHSLSANIAFSNGLLDATTKDSNSWEESVTGRKSFTISTDGLADFDDVADATAVEQFSAYALEGTKIFFQFQRASSTSGDLLGWTGEAFIESFEISAASDELVTYSVSLKGTGALSQAVVA